MLCNLDQIRLSGIARNVGLSELLTTQDPIRGHVLETQHPNLSLLPSGLLPPNPADLLSTQRMHKILVEAEQALHLVIIDGPPTLVLVLADSPLLAALSVTAFSLSRPVRRARRRRSAQPTGSDGDHILGAALTKASREAGYGYSRYGYGYGHPKVDKKRTEILMIPQGTEH